jgi:hypothetical protein
MCSNVFRDLFIIRNNEIRDDCADIASWRRIIKSFIFLFSLIVRVLVSTRTSMLNGVIPPNFIGTTHDRSSGADSNAP